jgi:hypothetical protein
MTSAPRLAVLTALQDLPESIWIPICWAILADLERLRTEGLHPDYAGQLLKGAIVQEFNALDLMPARGTPDRP